MQGWHIEPQRFQGTLAHGDESIDAGFTAGVADNGEVRVELDPVERSATSLFIETHWEGQGSDFGQFELKGSAENGVQFRTADLIFTTLNEDWINPERPLRPIGECSTAQFSSTSTSSDKAGFRMLLKDFRVRGRLSAETVLGNVITTQTVAAPRAGQISGEIWMTWPEGTADLTAWRTEADRLFDRIRHALSFALGQMIVGPVCEFVRGDRKEILIVSHASEDSPYMEVFQLHDLVPIYAAAIRTHYDPRFPVEKLNFAIEWLVMNAPYAEGRHIAAMTALENLVSSNLSKEDVTIQSDPDFERLRAALSDVTKVHATTLFENLVDRKRFVAEINEKFLDLNRRTLKQKIEMLAHRWSVSMDGLDPKAVGAALRARNSIVHTGNYTQMPGKDPELFDHMVLARELVVRFILAVLGFEGVYNSYVGGHHKRHFAISKNEPTPR